VRGLRGNLAQESFYFDVSEDDVGLPLKGFVVTPFETVPFLRRTNEVAGFDQKVLHFNKRELGRVIQELIDTNHQLREGVKPRKPRVIQHQVQQLAGRFDTAINAFVGYLFCQYEGLMETQEAAPHVEDLLAEVAGFLGSSLLRYRCHGITLPGY
jgi:hypothetical protein